MKKNFKFMVVTLLILSVVFITGCNSNEDDAGNAGGRGNGDVTYDAGNYSNTLTVWAWNVNVPVLERAGELFRVDNPNFELDILEISNADVYTRTTTALQAGGQGLPDIVLMEDSRIPGYVQNHPTAFVNLSERGFDAYSSEFPDFKLEVARVNGGVHAFPFDVGPVGVFYRRDLFEEANIDVSSIITWEDYIEAGRVLQDTLGINIMPIQDHTNDLNFRIMMNQQGTDYFNNGEIQFTSEESIRTMETIRSIVDAGITSSVSDFASQTAAIANGEVATMISGAWFAGTLMSQVEDQSGDWGVFPLPVFADVVNAVPSSNAGGSSFLIPTVSENIDLAYEFMTFFVTSPAVQEIVLENGLFPSLLSAYVYNQLSEETISFFGGQDILEFFGEKLSIVPVREFNQNAAQAQTQVINAQSLILSGSDIISTLEDAQSELENMLQ